ncbi:FG-GAP repeat domain-containing protein [Sorangium sp. So ce363]|uniref:FG-GAP repeat domain-containing protein n=1 Tax=Sorangium sp. So ce363 TaxID=3133304 RepID=UPI003F64492A
MGYRSGQVAMHPRCSWHAHLHEICRRRGGRGARLVPSGRSWAHVLNPAEGSRQRTLGAAVSERAGLRCLVKLMMLAGVLAAIRPPVSRAGNDLDRDTAGRALPSPGVAGQRASDGAWRVLQGDFNGDGMTDVLWVDTTSGSLAVWLMNGTQVLWPGPELPGLSGSGWRPIKPGDMNGDGLRDVIWNNSDRGSLAVWLMNGTQVLRPVPELPGPSGDGWNAISVADFNRDGLPDVPWYNSGRNSISVWLMNGTQVLWPGPELHGPSGGGWKATATGDLNSDGTADVLWLNSGESAIAVWLMDGTRLLAPGPELHGPSGGGWKATVAGDFNFDRMADVLWSNPGESSMVVWLMNGTQVLAPGPEIPGPSGSGWSPATSGDFNFDGMLDVLWYNPEKHAIAVWLLAGSQVLLPGPEIPGPGDRP